MNWLLSGRPWVLWAGCHGSPDDDLLCVQVEAEGEVLALFCGKEETDTESVPAQQVLVSPGNALSLLFTSDFSDEERYSGFQAHYSAVGEPRLHTFTQSPSQVSGDWLSSSPSLLGMTTPFLCRRGRVQRAHRRRPHLRPFLPQLPGRILLLLSLRLPAAL